MPAGLLDPISVVPCNGCVRCCRGDCIRLLPDDDASQYQTEPHDHFPGALMLAHKPNGDCVYLLANGCGIHGSAPRQCREMDCRNLARGLTFTQARKLNVVSVWRRGRELLEPMKGTR